MNANETAARTTAGGSGLEVRIAEELVEKARVEGLDLTGPNGLLAAVTKNVIAAALEAEMTGHLGYAKGLTTREIRDHLAEIYGAEVSRETISKVTDAVAAELDEWRNRPLDRVRAVAMIDCIYVRIRDGAVASRPVYVGIGLEGDRDALGLWVGDGSEGAKHWMSVLAELRNRGVDYVLIVCCDGLKGLPESIGEIWPQALVQLCVVHLVRASLRYAAKQHWGPISKALRVVYTEAAAEQRFVEFKAEWGGRYPMIIRTWEDAWEQFTPSLAFPPEIRRVVYTTNTIESMNARFRQAVRRRGHFPNDQAALKVLHLVIRDRRENRPNVVGKARGWKRALQQFARYFGDRVTDQTER